MKLCIDCGIEKEVTDYYCDKQGNPNQNFCKKCQNIRYKGQREKYRLANKDKVKKWKHNSYKNNIQQYIYSNARARAKSKKQEFTITRNDVIIPEFCPILGIKLEVLDSGRTGSSPSIDRLDNEKGYTPENILVISDRANTLKSDSTQEERRKIYNFYYDLVRKNNVKPN